MSAVPPSPRGPRISASLLAARLSSLVRGTRVEPSGLVSRSRPRAYADRLLGGYTALARWYRWLRPRWAWERTNPLGRATRRYVDEHGLVVRRGPFSGLTYPPEAVGHVAVLPAKLLGCYEAELAPMFDDLSAFATFVDIGSADGFYCVAVKRRCAAMRVIGYETTRSDRRMAAKLADLNEVSVELRATADVGSLNELPEGRLLIMMDVEGDEYHLADPAVVPRLAEATMIIEAHPAVHPDVADVLTARFDPTHDVGFVNGRGRDISSFPELAGWDPRQASYAVTEGRPTAALWLLLRPRAQAPRTTDGV